MILGSAEFISANSFNFFTLRNLLVRIANFLHVCTELISENLIQIRIN